MLPNPSYTDENDHAIARQAGRQHGLITTRQLRALGVSEGGIAHRVKVGRLHRLYRGVYAVGSPPTTPLARAAAAVLACGDEAVLSHGSALALFGLWKRWDEPFEVTAPTSHRREGIRVQPARTEVSRYLNVPVTTVPRTLLDIAPRIPQKSLRRLVIGAREAGLLHVQALGRYPGRLASLLAIPARSGFEYDFLAFCKRFHLPTPRANVEVAGEEVDAMFPDQRLIVELDGYGFHGDRYAFESDRERDARTLAAGFATVRITTQRLEERPAQEAARLKTILKARA